MIEKGIILAGGAGSRLRPVTMAYTKQLALVYDKPLIYYPLTTLLLMGVRDVHIICDKFNLSLFTRLLGDGADLGICITYSVQEKPSGIAEAPIIASNFLGGDDFILVLGDNILVGNNIIETLKSHTIGKNTVFAQRVSNPKDFGVATFDSTGNYLIGIEEKPANPVSDWALIGLYKYKNEVIDICQNLQPSSRNELEITDLNLQLLAGNNLNCIRFGRGVSWFDAGSFEGLFEAATYVRSVQHRQGGLLGSPEEAAFRVGLIDSETLVRIAETYSKTSYGNALLKVTSHI